MCSSSSVLIDESTEMDLLHDIASRITAADSLYDVLGRLLDFVLGIAKFDACFVYVLEGNELVLRASRNSHGEMLQPLRLPLDDSITFLDSAKPAACCD
jgi:uroporphyrinogen-III synthase